MVLSSGPVSLNIHEALTFDGAEICLHPDLFSTASNNTNGHVTIATNTNVTSGNINSSGISSVQPILMNRSHSLDEKPGLISRTSVGIGVTNKNTTLNKSLLKVGDMIEIRVWDAITQSTDIAESPATSSKAPSSIIRRRTATASTTSGSYMSVPHNQSESTTDSPSSLIFSMTDSVKQEKDNVTTFQPNQETKTNRNRANTGSYASTSLQYSESTNPELLREVINESGDFFSAVNQENVDKDSSHSNSLANTSDNVQNIASNASTRFDIPLFRTGSSPTTPSGSPIARTKTIDVVSTLDNNAVKSDNELTTSLSALPPVFPKGRTGATESQLKRPSSLQRRVVSHSTVPATTVATPGTTRHYRDLSDMTVESLSGVGAMTLSMSSEIESAPDAVNIQTHGTTTNDDGKILGTTTATIAAEAPSIDKVTSNYNYYYDDDDYDEKLDYLFKTHTLRLSFVMLVSEKTLTSLKGSARTQVSILRQVADLYHLSSYDTITVTKISKVDEEAVLSEVSADFVLVTIKDQFISRGDMHYFQNSLRGSWVYEGQRLHESSRGIQTVARAIRHGDKQTKSGIVTDKTHVTFRSRSARIFWLVQMSAEMWDYSSPYERGNNEGLCEIYFDKWISFVHELFIKWKEIEVTHSLTVAFFSRTFRYDDPSSSSNNRNRDAYGRLYDDHFRLVIENMTGPDWDTVVLSLKKAFVSYPSEVRWNLETDSKSRHPSNANQGNVLEAINVTLNLLQFHYFDRDLHRSGNSIVLISAGNGVFEVDQGLAGITYQVRDYILSSFSLCNVSRSLTFVIDARLYWIADDG